MSRLTQIAPEKAMGAVRAIFDGLKAKLGRVPNIFQNMANSEATLDAYMALSGLADKTSLSPQLREKIALTSAQENSCNYCLAAHTTIAKHMGMQESDILLARKADAEDSKTKAILKFVQLVAKTKGKVSDEEVTQLKKQGVSDKEICEIILLVTLNVFTNYFNNVVKSDIDFPQAPEL
jgi:uncharacterized peroxidase-related enzyme